MATARFTAELDAITIKNDVKVNLVLSNPDKALPDLVPMAKKNVVVILMTEQQDIDDYNRSLPPQGQQLTFDQTGFQVPANEGAGEETAEDETEQLVDCPECGNLDPARQDCNLCGGDGVIPADESADESAPPEEQSSGADPEPQAVAATGEEPDYWTPPEPYVKPEQVTNKENPPAAAGES